MHRSGSSVESSEPTSLESSSNDSASSSTSPIGPRFEISKLIEPPESRNGKSPVEDFFFSKEHSKSSLPHHFRFRTDGELQSFDEHVEIEELNSDAEREMPSDTTEGAKGLYASYQLQYDDYDQFYESTQQSEDLDEGLVDEDGSELEFYEPQHLQRMMFHHHQPEVDIVSGARTYGLMLPPSYLEQQQFHKDVVLGSIYGNPFAYSLHTILEESEYESSLQTLSSLNSSTLPYTTSGDNSPDSSELVHSSQMPTKKTQMKKKTKHNAALSVSDQSGSDDEEEEDDVHDRLIDAMLSSKLEHYFTTSLIDSSNECTKRIKLVEQLPAKRQFDPINFAANWLTNDLLPNARHINQTSNKLTLISSISHLVRFDLKRALVSLLELINKPSKSEPEVLRALLAQTTFQRSTSAVLVNLVECLDQLHQLTNYQHMIASHRLSLKHFNRHSIMALHIKRHLQSPVRVTIRSRHLASQYRTVLHINTDPNTLPTPTPRVNKLVRLSNPLNQNFLVKRNSDESEGDDIKFHWEARIKTTTERSVKRMAPQPSQEMKANGKYRTLQSGSNNSGITKSNSTLEFRPVTFRTLTNRTHTSGSGGQSGTRFSWDNISNIWRKWKRSSSSSTSSGSDHEPTSKSVSEPSLLVGHKKFRSVNLGRLSQPPVQAKSTPLLATTSQEPKFEYRSWFTGSLDKRNYRHQNRAREEEDNNWRSVHDANRKLQRSKSTMHSNHFSSSLITLPNHHHHHHGIKDKELEVAQFTSNENLNGNANNRRVFGISSPQPLGESKSMTVVNFAKNESLSGLGKLGEICLSVYYERKLNSLTIAIFRCQLTPETKPKNDLYVKAYVVPRSNEKPASKRKTKARRSSKVTSNAPGVSAIYEIEYNEILRFGGTEEEFESQSLSISVWQHDLFGRNSIVAQCVVPLEHNVILGAGTGQMQTNRNWYPLLPPKTMSGVKSMGQVPTGHIFLALKFEVNKFGTGQLHVMVKEGNHLNVAPNTSTFCKLSLRPERSKDQDRGKLSVANKMGPSPRWNQTVVFRELTKPDLASRQLHLTCWSSAPNKTLLGSLRLSNSESNSTNEEQALWSQMQERANLWVYGQIALT